MTNAAKPLHLLRDARRTQHAEAGGSRRHAPGAEGGAPGNHLGAQAIDNDLKTRVHAASLDAVDNYHISDRCITILGELGGAQRVRNSVLDFAAPGYARQRQATTLKMAHLFLSQKETVTFDVEVLGPLRDRTLEPGEQNSRITWDFSMGVAPMALGARLEFVGTTSRTWYADDGTGSGSQQRVGEVVPFASQVGFATRVQEMGVKDVLHHFGMEPDILEFIAPGVFTTHNIGELFAVLFRLTSHNKMTDFGCPVNMEALARLILDERFKHRAQSDVDHEFQCLLELLPALCCLLVGDSRFGQLLTSVCGPLPPLPADVVGPHRRLLTALRAIVMGGRREADLALVKGVVARVEEAARLCAEEAAARPRVQPETEAPRDAASQPRPKPRQRTPRPRDEVPLTTAQLRASGHLASLPEKPSRVLAVDWATKAQSLLDTIKKEQRERVRPPNLETFRPTLLRYGFSVPPELLDGRGRGISGPAGFPETNVMRTVAGLVRYLEGALANPEDSEETGTLASTAPAPLSRAQSLPPPQLVLPPPRAPLAQPSTVLGVGTIVKLPFCAYGFGAVGCVLETPSEVAESGLVCVEVSGQKLKIMKSDLGPIQRLAADTSPDTVAPMKKKRGGDGKASTTKEKKISPFKKRPTAPDALSKLVAAGIERSAAEAALEAHGGDLPAAANKIVAAISKLATAVPSDGAVSSLLDTSAANESSIDEAWDDSDKEASSLLDTNEDRDDMDEEASGTPEFVCGGWPAVEPRLY